MPKPKTQLTDRSAGEEAFINEITRKFLVAWCQHQIETEGLPSPDWPGLEGWTQPYIEYAQKKGWLSKDGTRILAPGWKTAATFLRR
jgi:hypothetical protein